MENIENDDKTLSISTKTEIECLKMYKVPIVEQRCILLWNLDTVKMSNDDVRFGDVMWGMVM